MRFNIDVSPLPPKEEIMEFIKSWKFMAIIVAVLAVVSIAGVIVGVMTHTEPGLDPNMPRWSADDMPLGLCVFTYGHEWDQDTGLSATDAHLERTGYAVELINERLGFAAYQIRSGDDCDVMLTYGEPAERGIVEPGGGAWVDGEQCYATTVNVHGEIEMLTVQHELGHCLGLADDSASFTQSIMRDVQVETPPRAFPPWISDFDRELLRGIYTR